MSGALREARRRVGLSQAELAVRAGVSRALVSTIESGRHVPSVGAALRIAEALGTTVEALFSASGRRTDVVGIDGKPLRPGALGRVGRVGDVAVAAPLAARSALLWPVPDVVGDDAGASLLPGAVADGFVVAGCEPALGIAEGMLGSRGPARLVVVPCSTAAALDGLVSGRCHAAVVHGRPDDVATLEVEGVDRWHVARWRVGLAYRSERRAAIEELAAQPVVSREEGAASQRALERAVAAVAVRPARRGAVAAGHLDAARIGVYTGMPAVTYEPAAERFGLRFLSLESHVVELWIAGVWREHPGALALVELLASTAFRRRIEAIGAYDLGGCGSELSSRRAEPAT
jgi:transcriptional regulator with XRE-family HTH domain